MLSMASIGSGGDRHEMKRHTIINDEICCGRQEGGAGAKNKAGGGLF